MLSLIKKLFAKKESIDAPWPFPTGTTPIEKPADEPVAETPVATPEPAKCGCGRSPSGLCVGLHALSAEEWAINDANPAKVESASKPKKVAKPKVAAKKPRQRKPKAQ